MSTHKKIWSVLTSLYLFVGNIFVTPTEAYAVAVADRIKCESLKDADIKWTKQLSKIYAWTVMSNMYPDWGKSEYKALIKLWTKESNWDHTSDNPNSSAYGIAQMLKTKKGTPAPAQIERGLSYIEHRYTKPSIAWSHWRKHKWY